MIPVKECADKQILEPCSLKNFDFQVDPYIGCEHYCYYCYVLNNTAFNWTKEIRIHKDFISRLQQKLDQIEPQKIYMGYNSDPYQPCEEEYQQTRQALQLFKEKGFSIGILTKSDLVLRDIDILKKMDNASVSVSVAFLNNKVRNLFEANTIDTTKRIEALTKLKESGIKTSALLCPVIPHITDCYELIEKLASCTDVIWIYALSILDKNEISWQNVQRILKNQYPSLLKEIESAVFSKDHPYWLKLRNELNDIKKKKQLNLNIHV